MIDSKHFDPTLSEWAQRDGPIRCIRLRDVIGGRSTFVTETPAGVFIHGDVIVGPANGVGSTAGRSLWWLACARGAYLYGDFLTQEWSAERFLENVAALTQEEIEDYGYHPEYLADILDVSAESWRERGPYAAYSEWTEMGGEGEDMPGYGYNAKHCAILDEIAECVREFMERAP